MWGCSFPDVCIRVLEPYLCMDAGRCGLHVCVIDFSWIVFIRKEYFLDIVLI